MKRYEPRPELDGWTVFDSTTREILDVPHDHRSRDGAQAYSTLLNDLEGIGRRPVAEARCEA